MAGPNNPDRYDYDPSDYYYDEDSDTLTSRDDSSVQYTGDGEKVDDSDW